MIEGPGDGPWQMAVDEVLLDSAALHKTATLRFDRWQTPTVSLGYFQHVADRAQHPASLACPLVRRLSGGRAIVHDHELTYCLTLPAEHPLAYFRHRGVGGGLLWRPGIRPPVLRNQFDQDLVRPDLGQGGVRLRVQVQVPGGHDEDDVQQQRHGHRFF